jgi:replicative DNA helicase
VTEETTDNRIPCDIYAEMSVLGAIMFGGRAAMDKALEILDHGDFYRDTHRHIWNACCAIAAKGDEPDVATLRAKLESLELLEAIGGLDYLLQLDQISFSTGNLEQYGAIIRDHAIRRRVLWASDDIKTYAQNTEISGADLLRRAGESLTLCDTGKTQSPWIKMGELAERWEAAMNERVKSQSGLTGISSGLQAVDRATGGFRKGELIILAARPAAGKSALAGSIGNLIGLRHGPCCCGDCPRPPQSDNDGALR